MSGTKKKGESPKSQRGPAHSKNGGIVRWLQGKFSRLLSWLSSLFGESNIPKALAGQILRAVQRWVAKMSPAQFICLLGALAIITVIALLWGFYSLWNGDESDNYPAHRSITVWISEMEDSTEPNDTFVVKSLIRNNLNVFDVENSKPIDSDQTVITVPVGCYRKEQRKVGTIKELRIGITEPKWDRQPETYRTVSELPIDKIIRDIGTRILDEYPPEGTIYELQPPGDVPSGQHNSLGRKVYLNIGRLDGVRERDVFQVIPPRGERFFHRSTIEIFSTGPNRSTAYVPWEQEIEEGWSVKWIKAGY